MKPNKERIKWSPRFNHWYHVSSWVYGTRDQLCLAFVIELNKLNGKRN